MALGGLKVAIVGAGRMGTLLANRIPNTVRKVIISKRKAQATALADEVGGIAADQMTAVRGCQVVLLAVPATAVFGVVQEMAPHLDDGALVVNMVTDQPTDQLQAEFPRHRFAAAKLIGHAREMALGSPGVVVLDHVSTADEARLSALLEALGSITVAGEERVLAVNTAVVEIMAKAEAELRDRLLSLGLEPDLVKVAITTTGPGVLRALAAGEIGPFAQQVIARLQAEESFSAPAPE